MVMVEEEEIFSVFARGRQIMFQENVEKVGEEVDRISVLPDCLLLEILSRLPITKEAIRTGTLSKRWEHLWTWLPTLKFQHSNDDDDNHSQSEFVSTVDKTLTQCRQLKLKKFQLMFTSYDTDQYESQVNNWIRYALSCNVEELHLMLWNDEFSPDLRVDQSLFICTCFSHLRVSGCEFNPVGAISWKNLRSLCISHVRQLNEEMIENILSGSPILETLVLEYCHGYRRLDITSKSLKNLVFSGYIFFLVPLFVVESDIIEINAPNILSLTIQHDMELWKPLLVDVSSLVEANLDYTKLGYLEEEENLKGCILNLRHVKELTIGANCSMVASGLEAKGFVFPSNVKFVKSNWFGSDSVESKD